MKSRENTNVSDTNPDEKRSRAGSGMTTGIMLHMVLTWIVMMGLVGVFTYLVVTARRA